MKIIAAIKKDFVQIPQNVKWVTYMSAIWLFGW